MTADRKRLYKKLRTKAVKTDESLYREVKAQIDTLSRELSKLRKEVRLCDDIAVRSGIMQEKLRTVRQDENTKRKEQIKDEQFRRRSGTDR